jgi:hypothetical protein
MQAGHGVSHGLERLEEGVAAISRCLSIHRFAASLGLYEYGGSLLVYTSYERHTVQNHFARRPSFTPV